MEKDTAIAGEDQESRLKGRDNNIDRDFHKRVIH
jgi:hypothetical protein